MFAILFMLETIDHIPLSKNSSKKSIPREQKNQNKDMKITDPVLLSLFMRDNEKYNISHAP